MSDARDVPGEEILLEVRGLKVSGLDEGGRVRTMLVDEVSFALRAGETLALVGESGAGKTLTALAVMDLLPAGVRVEAGSTWMEGRSLLDLDPRDRRSLRGCGIAMVFQESASALDPLLTVGQQIRDVVRRHGTGDPSRARAVEFLREFDFDEPERVAGLRPHELSGGMAQRALLALTLACEPRVLICDEPTRGLDAQTALTVVGALDRARSPLRAQLLVSHDLDAVCRVASRVAVMHAGQVVEFLNPSSSADLAGSARHPYTQALLAARPGGEPGRRLATLAGDPPPPGSYPAGCRFAPRCTHAHARCREEVPGWFGDAGALPGEVADGVEDRWRCFGWAMQSGGESPEPSRSEEDG